MSTLEDGKQLTVPFDAKANNFHLDASGEVALLDVFPPMNRNKDGSFPIQNVPQSQSWIRQRVVPYMNGTREGAMVRFLSTVDSKGASPARQAKQIVRSEAEWAYDAIPDNIDVKTRATLERAIRHRFAAQFVIATASGAIHSARNAAGLPRYK